MNKALIVSVFVTIGCACSPKATTSLHHQMSPSVGEVVVLDSGEPALSSADSLGIVKVGETGLSVQCSYEKVLDIAQQKAREAGGNLIRIVQHTLPNAWSSCHKITGVIYRVADLAPYVQYIEWSADRRLEWPDFKAKVRPLVAPINAAAVTQSGFTVKPMKIGFPSFKINAASIKTYFDCQLSWGDSSSRTQDILAHEQLHFDISELIARQLRKKLSASGPLGFQEFEKLYQGAFKNLSKMQTDYDREAGYGNQDEAQARWNKQIFDELEKLEAYSDPIVELKKRKHTQPSGL